MLGKRERSQETRKRHLQNRLKQYKFSQAQGAALTRRVYEIRRLDLASRPDAVLNLFKDARHQVSLMRQSITDQTRYDFSCLGDEPVEGDLAASLAEQVTSVMRENTVERQTYFDSLFKESPEVHFTVDWYDVTILLAAMFRELHLAGVIEGLDLAGVLKNSSGSNPS
jgi:hypothetical protein